MKRVLVIVITFVFAVPFPALQAQQQGQEKTMQVQCRDMASTGNFLAPNETIMNGMACHPVTAPAQPAASPDPANKPAPAPAASPSPAPTPAPVSTPAASTDPTQALPDRSTSAEATPQQEEASPSAQAPPAQKPLLPNAPMVISFALIDGQGVVHPHVNPNGWLEKWIRKNAKKHPNVQFRDNPVQGARNFVIVFSTSASAMSGFDAVLRTNTSTSTSPVSGNGTVTDNYGSTWNYSYNGEITTTTTTTAQENVPYTIESNTVYATAYDEHGQVISQHWHVYSTKQGGDTANSIGYNLGSALASINARGRLVNAVVKDVEASDKF